VAGCPPHPITFIDGVLRLLGRVESGELKLAGTGIVERR
jgi:Ni,Fe-hydrogenase III small subunit